jgi:hypothetical protein
VNARAYYQSLQSAIHAAPHVLRSDVRFEEIDVNECYVSGVLLLMGSFELHIAEYVVTDPVLTRLKYRYHLQTADGQLVSRWDNAAHHPTVSTFPHHRHDEQDGIHPASPMSVLDALESALQFILPSQPD